MNSLLKCLIFGALLSFHPMAYGGLLLEPYLNQSLTGDADDGSVGGIDADTTQLLYGARLGWATPMGFMIGGDFQLGQGEWDQAGAVDSSIKDLGAFVGYQSMMGLRVFLSYMFNAETTIDSSPESELTGTGFKVGVGYNFMHQGAPWFAINVEYHAATFDESEQGSSSGPLVNEIDATAILVGVSFPIDFDMI